MKHLQKGVTLVELVISIIILSIAMVALMSAFSNSMLNSADPLWRNKTLKLAQLYLDEILAKNYDHNTPVGGVPYVAAPSCTGLGPETGETRETFNDVDDYHGLTESADSLTTIIDSSYDSYQVSVEVVCRGSDVNASANIHAKKITVTITPPSQVAIPFSVYKGNF
jgi:MSHA pilin protein MshD